MAAVRYKGRGHETFVVKDEEPIITPRPPESVPENAPDCAHTNDIAISIVPATKIRSLYDRGMLDEAAAGIMEHLEENPEDAEARLILGDIYERKGMYEEAVAQYVEVVRLRPEDGMMRFKLETALRQMKK